MSGGMDQTAQCSEVAASSPSAEPIQFEVAAFETSQTTSSFDSAIFANAIDGMVSVSVSDAQAIEGNNAAASQLSFQISLSEMSTEAITVNYQTNDGTGGNGADSDDYTAIVSGAATFEPGETFKDVLVDLTDDGLVESDENFTLDITSVIFDVSDDLTAVAVQDRSGEGTIVNDDVTSASIGDVSIVEGADEASSVLEFTITLDSEASSDVTVEYQTNDGTADSPSDFVGVSSGSVVFAAGETSKTIAVTINGDALVEGDEAFTVDITAVTFSGDNASDATAISDNRATGTILDDDIRLTMSSITPTNQNEGNTPADGVAYSFTVTRAGLDTGVTEVGYTISGVDASDIDGPLDATITFGSGSDNNVQTVTIMVAEDTVVETNETFTVTLSGASHAPDLDEIAADSIEIVNGMQMATITNDDSLNVSVSECHGHRG